MDLTEIKTVRFIGDVHGKLDRFRAIVNDSLIDPDKVVVQVGDTGVNDSPGWITQAQLDEVYGRWFYIRGNHDNPEECWKTLRCMSDGNLLRLGKYKAMVLGGAMSTDRAQRTAGIDWWADEELSFTRLGEVVEDWAWAKPDILISHCPSGEFMERLGTRRAGGIALIGSRNLGRTGAAIDQMFQLHRPKLHVFGHMHIRRTEVIDDIQCECLPELGWIDLDVS